MNSDAEDRVKKQIDNEGHKSYTILYKFIDKKANQRHPSKILFQSELLTLITSSWAGTAATALKLHTILKLPISLDSLLIKQTHAHTYAATNWKNEVQEAKWEGTVQAFFKYPTKKLSDVGEYGRM